MTHINYEKKGKDGGEACLTHGEDWLWATQTEKLRREVDPQLALILKVVRNHLRKWGI